MFKLTPQAARQVQEAAKQGGTEGMALRFAAQKNDDGTFAYLMGFDEVKDDDIQFESEGVSVVMEPEQVPLLDETTMDYTTLDDGEKKFIFINPKDSNYSPKTS